MILISQALNFTVEKAADAVTRSRLVQASTELDLFLLTDTTRLNPFRISAESRVIINRVWPLFVQAPGINPGGNLTQTPAPMAIRLKHSGSIFLISDWRNGANLNLLLENVPDVSGYHDMVIENFAFVYDALNVQDIYENTNARAYVCLDIEAVPYVV
jgi:hypothetical protein